MTGRRTTNWGRPVRHYVCRKNTAGARHPGCSQTVPAASLDGAVWDRVVTWLHYPERLAGYLQTTSNSEYLDGEARRIQAHLDRLQRSRDGLMRVLEEGLAPAEDVVRRLEGIREREGVLRQRCQHIHVALTTARQQRPRTEDVGREAREALERLRDGMPFTKRQEIVRAFIRRIVVSGGAVTLYRVATVTG